MPQVQDCRIDNCGRIAVLEVPEMPQVQDISQHLFVWGTSFGGT